MSKTSKKLLLIGATILASFVVTFNHPDRVDAGYLGSKQVFIMNLSTAPLTLRKAVNEFKHFTPEQVSESLDPFHHMNDNYKIMSDSKDTSRLGGFSAGPAGNGSIVTIIDSNGDSSRSFDMNTDPRATTVGAIKKAVKEAQAVGY